MIRKQIQEIHQIRQRDDQNKGDETPADSTTDPSNDANTSDGGNNGSTTTEVTLAVDDTVAESG